MRSAVEMHSKARLWQARTVSGASPTPALAVPLAAAMRMPPRERRSQSQANSSPSWKARKRSRAKAANSGYEKLRPFPSAPLSGTGGTRRRVQEAICAATLPE
uniref:Uncharacterized protein n=1 Tax=Podarcis muralis TaxID=64176 RepID=A0A670IE89_PODMU